MLRTSAVLLVALISACAQNPPLVVKATGVGEACTVNIKGEVFSDKEIYRARLRRLAKKHNRRLVVDSDSGTPYRCIGGAVFGLQRDGFRVVSVRIDGIELPSR